MTPEDEHKTNPEPDAPVPRRRGRPRKGGSADHLPVVATNPPKKTIRNREPTSPDFVPDRVMWTIKEAAASCGCTEFFLRSQIRAGKIRVSQFSEFIIRILPSELVAWAERERTELGVVREVSDKPYIKNLEGGKEEDLEEVEELGDEP